MALQKNIEQSAQGVPVENAYFRLVGGHLLIENRRLIIDVRVFHNRECSQLAKEGKVKDCGDPRFEVPLSDELMQAIYAELKKLPEFEGAVDV